MVKHSDQRVAVFVDAQNMYHSARHLYSANVNFQKVLEGAVAGRKLIRAVVYSIASPEAEEAKFLDALEKQGYELKIKDLQVFAGGAKKGDWDVGLAVDAIKMGDKVDVIVLVTGDGDFIPLVNYLQENKGCLVEVLSFKRSTSSRLLEVIDDFTDMEEDPSNYMLMGQGRKRIPTRAAKRGGPRTAASKAATSRAASQIKKR